MRSLTRSRLYLTHRYDSLIVARVSRQSFIESLRDAGVHRNIFITLRLAKALHGEVLGAFSLPLERYRIVLNFLYLNSRIDHVVVQRLKLSLIV